MRIIEYEMEKQYNEIKKLLQSKIYIREPSWFQIEEVMTVLRELMKGTNL